MSNIVYDNQNGKVIFNIPCVSRYAPTILYDMHIGHAWISYFTYATTKENNGQFIVRFDDIIRGDIFDSDKTFAQDHLNGLAWLGIVPDKVIWMSDMINDIHGIIEKELGIHIDTKSWFASVNELLTYHFSYKDIFVYRNKYQVYEIIYSAAADIILGANYIVRGEDLLYISGASWLAMKLLNFDTSNIFMSYIPIVRCEGTKISKSNPVSDKLFLKYLIDNGMTGEELIRFLRKVCLKDSEGPISYNNLNFYPNFSISDLPLN